MLTSASADLRRFARAYNSQLAMAAVLTQPGARTNPHGVHNSRLSFSMLRGATCFLANGLESRREIADVARSAGTGLPSYYFHDSNALTENHIFGNCTVRLVKALGDILQESNPLVRGYVKIRDIIKDTRSAVETPIVRINTSRSGPILNSAALLVPFARAKQNHLPYVFALKLDAGHHNGRFYDKRMNVLSAEYEPLAFPLLFPFGQPGWSPELKKSRRHCLRGRRHPLT
ncbi:hypothetical protein H9P43_007495 [Blastocladiella emersonii ATCC 22665]|nr:hypothetical protein H9P43_007495 [Blastocladiella emersonii ATCC 22665]